MINIATQFSPNPAGRTPADGPFNGERFRQDFLIPAIEEAISGNRKVVVSLDGANSYSSSFLEEAFGGVIRERKFAPDVLGKHLEIRSSDPVYESFRIDVLKYMRDALRAGG